jgi:hypothetical protein
VRRYTEHRREQRQAKDQPVSHPTENALMARHGILEDLKKAHKNDGRTAMRQLEHGEIPYKKTKNEVLFLFGRTLLRSPRAHPVPAVAMPVHADLDRPHAVEGAQANSRSSSDQR